MCPWTRLAYTIKLVQITVKVYHNSVLTLYVKGLVLKVIIAISVIFTAISKWLKALLASSILVEVALLDINSPKVIK